MWDYIAASVITLGALAFIGWRMMQTQMAIPENVEVPLAKRQRLQFALDNDLPINK